MASFVTRARHARLGRVPSRFAHRRTAPRGRSSYNRCITQRTRGIFTTTHALDLPSMPLLSLSLAAALALAAPVGDPWRPGAPPLVTPAVWTGSGTAADPVLIDWRTLGGMNPQTGAVAPALRALAGQVVRIAGYVVPLDDASQEDAEFLLVPYYGACVHTPPPPPNQMVLVEMEGRRRVRLDLFEAIWLEGRLGIDLVESLYGTAGFTIKGMSVSPYVKK
jgi:uncharacterized protein